MRWLIVEDALKDRQGHWLEWVTTFDRGFRELGDEVTVLADSEVEADIRDTLRAEPILPRSIWHRLGDGARPLTRYNRVLTHNWQTWRVLKRYLRSHPEFDAIFVPTVSVHHVLAWVRLIKGDLRQRKTRVLLFLLNAPARVDPAGIAISDDSPTARLLIASLKWLGAEIQNGKVVLGVETKAMKAAYEKLTGLPVVCFPQPVAAPACKSRTAGEWIEMACFGAARAEKGSDVLQEAIRLHRRKHPASRARFTVQWIDDFHAGGRQVTKATDLQRDPQIRFVTRYFEGDEYAEHLRRTDVMLLPYRLSSYALRGSRVVIEAAVNGIPVVVTRGTTLASLADDFGAGVWCEDGDAQSLAGAIAEMESRYDEMRLRATAAKAAAVEHFSVPEFRRRFEAAAKLVPAAKPCRAMPTGPDTRTIKTEFSHEP